MNAKISLMFLILVAVSHTCDGLTCYVCSSSATIFDASCDNGDKSVRAGVCPFNYKACSIKRFTYPDGSKGVLRDCALSAKSNDEIISEDGARLVTSNEYKCTYNYCNAGIAGNAASSISHFGQSISIWVLAGMVFFCLQIN